MLIVRKGSGITLDDVLKCGKRYNFGLGDPESTSGTLAPMAYVFIPHKIEPTDCFKTVRSASHQSNLFCGRQRRRWTWPPTTPSAWSSPSARSRTWPPRSR